MRLRRFLGVLGVGLALELVTCSLALRACTSKPAPADRPSIGVDR